MFHQKALTVQYTKFHTISVKQFRTERLCNGKSAHTVDPNKPLYLQLAASPRLFPGCVTTATATSRTGRKRGAHALCDKCESVTDGQRHSVGRREQPN